MSQFGALEAGVAAFAAHVAIATALIRMKPKSPPVLLHMASAGFVCVALTGFIYFGDEDATALWLSVSILYGGAVGFLFLFSAVYKSISLELLCALTTAPRQHLNRDAINRLVLPRFTERIELLVSSGLVSQTGDRYIITGRGRELALRFRALRRVTGIAQSGLYAREAK